MLLISTVFCFYYFYLLPLCPFLTRNTYILKFKLILFIALGVSNLAAQDFPKEYFRSPLDIPLFLSGNFGELRTGHYHSGLDIKTQGREGFKVFSVADGFVSRIKISPWGYGNAVYITHPNGHTSVYAHLQKFSSKIARIAKKYQYAQKTFAIDKILQKGVLKVKKGEVIALSGNSGSSSGPHLHFEIRETATEKPTNTLLYGFDIQDTVQPVLRKLYVYDLEKMPSEQSRKGYDLIKQNNAYSLKNNDTIRLNAGRIGFALDMRDYMNIMRNYYGIYKLRLYVNDVLKHSFTFNKFSFAESRYINAHIDYDLFKTHKRRIHKLFHEPNQKESFCEVSNRGIPIYEGMHKVFILVEDAYGNKTQLQFFVSPFAPNNSQEKQNLAEQDVWEYNKANRITATGFYAEIPANTFYNSVKKQIIGQEEKTDKGYAPLYHFLTDKVPLHKRVTVGIKPQNLPENQKKKAFLARKHKKNYQFVGNKWKGGFITGQTKQAGDFTVLVDATPPTIKRWKGADYRRTGKLRYRISDALSGVKTYNGYIDNKWVLFEYDAKRNLLWHTLTKEQIKRHTKHTLRLVVTDKCGNKAIRKATFTW